MDKKIIRNKDENGMILTYTVKMENFDLEFNTLKEAKIMAVDIDEVQ